MFVLSFNYSIIPLNLIFKNNILLIISYYDIPEEKNFRLYLEASKYWDSSKVITPWVRLGPLEVPLGYKLWIIINSAFLIQDIAT